MVLILLCFLIKTTLKGRKFVEAIKSEAVENVYMLLKMTSNTTVKLWQEIKCCKNNHFHIIDMILSATPRKSNSINISKRKEYHNQNKENSSTANFLN